MTARQRSHEAPLAARATARAACCRRAAVCALLVAAAIVAAGCSPEAPGVAPAGSTASASANATSSALFAVEIRIGPTWDAAKPAEEQAYFAEHSANLRRVRETGSLVLGARYADVGFLVLSVESIDAARAMLDVDPAIANGTFRYDIHPFNIFYPWPTAAGAP